MQSLSDRICEVGKISPNRNNQEGLHIEKQHRVDRIGTDGSKESSLDGREGRGVIGYERE